MEAKISQNSLLEASWGALGTSWGLLGGSWVLLEQILKKNLEGTTSLEANLGVKIHQKSKKIDAKKTRVLRYGFALDFLRFCIDFGSSKP